MTPSTGKPETGNGGGQLRAGRPSVPTHKLFAPLPPDTRRGGGHGEKEKPERGTVAAATEGPLRFLPRWRRQGRGRRVGPGCHALLAQCCRAEKRLEPRAAMMTHAGCASGTQGPPVVLPEKEVGKRKGGR